MKPMTECKGFNMVGMLLTSKKYGYLVTGYYKDGMIKADDSKEWTHPDEWDGFILFEDLRSLLGMK